MNVNNFGIRTAKTLSVAALTLLALTALPPSGRAQNMAAPQAATDSPPVTSAYVLAPSDQIEIFVQGHDEAHQQVQILPDGTFTYPNIDKPIKAAGMTVAKLTAFLTKNLSDYYNQPEVTVTVRENHIQKIKVAGVARSPGLYDYRPGVTLLEIVSQSGGSALAPELTSLTLVTQKNGQVVSIPINLVDLLNGDATQNIVLSPGDTLLFSSSDPAKAEVQIVGQVNHPGTYPVVKEGATVIAMLSAAGGVTPTAALTKVQVTHDGQTKTYDLHPTLFDINDPSGQVHVFAGDSINVPTNNSKIAVQGEVRLPQIYPMPDGEALSVMTALTMAGGPTQNGDKKEVGIMRLGKDNQRHLIAVNLEDLYKSHNTTQAQMQVADFPLQDKDILIVPTRNHKRSVGDFLSAVPGYYYLSTLLGARPNL